MLLSSVRSKRSHQSAIVPPGLDLAVSMRERASRNGAAGYLRNPFDQETLLETIGWAISEDTPGWGGALAARAVTHGSVVRKACLGGIDCDLEKHRAARRSTLYDAPP
jgi:hypothetical protein